MLTEIIGSRRELRRFPALARENWRRETRAAAAARRHTVDYSIHMDVKYAPLELIDAGGLADACTERWWNQTLARVNDCIVRLGVFQGEFHWHKHDREDEFFHVLEGELLVDLEGRTVALGPRQGLVVPRGVMHRTRAPARTVVLMIESASVVPTGD
jgi:mannose-6-phosphate isomerase-like protein (cupin superfamily)